jgi:hypothetical protein
LRLPADLVALVALAFRLQRTSADEIPVRRRQLPLYKGLGIRPRRIDAASRISQVLLFRLRDWRSCLTIVRPAVVIGWQRAGWRLRGRYKSRPGPLRIAVQLRQPIRRMASENSVWAEARIAYGLLLNPRRVMRRTRLDIISDFLIVNERQHQ